MDIGLIVVGKIKEKYLIEGIAEYLKRIKPYANLKIVEIKEQNSNDTIKNINLEGVDILSNVANDDFLITLEINGIMLDSTELSKYIQNHYTYNSKKIVFVIGGSDGLSNSVKSRSNYKLSFSKMTFPHQLMRMIFLEQLYRCFMIINNHKYHK